MKISKYAKNVEPSLARALFNKAKNYSDVIDLTLGDPDFNTPKAIGKAACKSIKRGLTKYSANAGLKEARLAVAHNIKRVWGISANADEEILISVGGMEALFLSLASIIDPGDEVIVFAPYYVNYVQMISFLGGVPKIINAYNEENGLYVDESILRNHISDKTIAIIVNSPNNPTGCMFGVSELTTIANVAKDNDLIVISDEVYRSLIYDGNKHESILSNYNDMHNLILVDSLSKEFCMTGWRVGYAYGDKRIIENMIKLQENVAACAPLPSQYALIKAYTKPPKTKIREKFEIRRNTLYVGINNISGLSCLKPKGTFYLFVNIEKTGLNSMEFAKKLLEKYHVAVVPGKTYGKSYDNYIRIAFTKDVKILERALVKIKAFVESLNIK